MKKICTLFSLFLSTLCLAQDGTQDGTFGTQLSDITAGTVSAERSKLVAQADGKLVMSFSVVIAGKKHFGVARFLADGKLDLAGFGGGVGYVTIPIGSGDASAYSVEVQNDGKILVAGSATGSSNIDFAVARLNIDGSLDNSFGTSGISIIPVSGNADIAYSIALQGDQKIVLAGNADSDFGVVRLNTNGSPDLSFD